MNKYLDFPDMDGTPISISQLNENSISLEPHCHEFYELVLVTKGSCRHIFNGVTVLAAPGDVSIIPPHQVHCYKSLSEVSIINCCFIPEKINTDWHSILKDISPEQSISPSRSSEHALENHWQHAVFDPDTLGLAGPAANAPELQGLIHLDGSEYTRVFSLMHNLIEEQEFDRFGKLYMKSGLLQIILVLLGRLQTKKLSRLNDYSDRKKKLVNDALAYMENHVEEITSSTEIAEKLYLSPAYFRSLFKDITGMTPTNYLNRLRVIRSLEYLEREDLSIAEAAGRVGIYDSNYYSRLFKKTMCYSPRYFKKKR